MMPSSASHAPSQSPSQAPSLVATATATASELPLSISQGVLDRAVARRMHGMGGGALQAETIAEGPTDRAEALRFRDLCRRLERMITSKSSGPRGDRLSKHLLSKQFERYLERQTIYPVLRLILPDLDSERTKYGIQEKNLAKLLVRAQGWAPENTKARQINGWKDTKIVGPNSGDLSAVVFSVLDDNIHQSNGMTVGEVNDRLDQLAAADSEAEKVRVLTHFLNSMEALELKFLVRIILKDMKLGFKHTSVFRRLHPDAAQQYNSHLDLRRLCAEIRDPAVRLTPRVALFTPISPMLCWMPKGAIADAADGFQDVEFAIEVKLDGERVIIHYDRSRVDDTFIHSRRNAVDIGIKYGYKSALLRALQRCIKVDRCIIDAEVLGYNRTTDSFTEFSTNRPIATKVNNNLREGRREDADDEWLCLQVFDILYVEGYDFGRFEQRDPGEPSLTGLSLRERRAILTNAVCEWEHRLEIVRQVRVCAPDKKARSEAIIKHLELAMTARQEGLVLKNLESPYVLDGRQRDSWVKVKPEYCDGLGETLDVLILGGYLGKGKLRTGGVSHFMVGVAKDPLDKGHPTEFYTIGKVGTGYSRAELEKLRRRLDKHARPWGKGESGPPHLMGWRPAKTDDVPDFWYPPEHAVVLEVMGAELVSSDNWSSFYTIRFPRCRQIRYDKEWHQCMTFVQVQNLVTENSGVQRSLQVRSRAHKSNSSRGRAATRLALPAVGAVPECFTQRAVNAKEVARESALFAPGGSQLTSYVSDFRLETPIEFEARGKTYRVTEAKDVARILIQNGAKHYALLPRKVVPHIFVAPPESCGPSVDIENCKLSNCYDMVGIDYVIRCLQAGETLPPKYQDFVYICRETREHPEVGKNFDKYGDSFLEAASKRSLENCMHECDVADAGPGEMKRARLELLKEESDPLLTPTTLFRGAVLYFDQYDEVRDSPCVPAEVRDGFAYSALEVAMVVAGMQYAVVSPVLDAAVTHVVMDSHVTKSRVDEVRRVLAALRRAATGRRREPRVVDENWVLAVIEQKRAWETVSCEMFRKD